MNTFVRDLLAALVLFPVSATYILSYTALVYSGPLASHRPAGLAAMLVTTLVAGLLTALASSFRFAFGTLDNNATAIMATVAASIAAEMGAGAHPGSVLATVMVGMAIAGVAAGGAMLAIGLARAGGVVRLLPLQVMAGFLGATGWILASGGLRVSLGRSPWRALLLMLRHGPDRQWFSPGSSAFALSRTIWCSAFWASTLPPSATQDG
ncbi:MAG: hypothetical protein ACM3PD_10730 [Chloroflexota bacterium]